jgi:ABC-2 type transport system ATP-binding protein
MKAAIKLKNLAVQRDGQPILNGITAELPAGQVIGLLGPSGAGKTTLMRAIVGLQRIKPGSITVLGQLAGAASLRHEIGYVTQAPSVYPDLTAHENLSYFAAMMGVAKSRAAAVLADVDLLPQRNLLASKLSGGQISRLSLAIALLGRPKLLVLDEPTVGVDPILRANLWQQFRELTTSGITLLVSSHVMDEAGHCDQLLLLRDGRLLAQGRPQELQAQAGADSIEAAFIKLVEHAS